MYAFALQVPTAYIADIAKIKNAKHRFKWYHGNSEEEETVVRKAFVRTFLVMDR